MNKKWYLLMIYYSVLFASMSNHIIAMDNPNATFDENQELQIQESQVCIDQENKEEKYTTANKEKKSTAVDDFNQLVTRSMIHVISAPHAPLEPDNNKNNNTLEIDNLEVIDYSIVSNNDSQLVTLPAAVFNLNLENSISDNKIIFESITVERKTISYVKKFLSSQPIQKLIKEYKKLCEFLKQHKTLSSLTILCLEVLVLLYLFEVDFVYNKIPTMITTSQEIVQQKICAAYATIQNIFTSDDTTIALESLDKVDGLSTNLCVKEDPLVIQYIKKCSYVLLDTLPDIVKDLFSKKIFAQRFSRNLLRGLFGNNIFLKNPSEG